MKWVPFINERYTGERGTFSVINGIQKGKGLDLGGWLGGGCLPEESFVKYLSPGLYHASRGFFPVLSVTQLVCLRT